MQFYSWQSQLNNEHKIHEAKMQGASSRSTKTTPPFHNFPSARNSSGVLDGPPSLGNNAAATTTTIRGSPVSTGGKAPATKIPLPVALDSAFTSFIAEARAGNGWSSGSGRIPFKAVHNLCISPRPPLRVVEFWLRSFKIPLRVQANGSSLSPPLLSLRWRTFVSRCIFHEGIRAFRSSFVFRAFDRFSGGRFFLSFFLFFFFLQSMHAPTPNDSIEI